MTNKISGLIKKAILSAFAAGTFAGCDEPKEVKLDELVIKEGPVRVEIIKRIKVPAQGEFGADDYLINIYDSNGGLRASINKPTIGSCDLFVHKTDSGSYVVTGIDPRFNQQK